MASINSADKPATALQAPRALGPIGKVAPTTLENALPEALLAYLYVYPEQNGALDRLITMTCN